MSSIITVVSLIQGMNSTVTDAVMSDLGADTFTIDRMGMTTNEEDLERARNSSAIEEGAFGKFARPRDARAERARGAQQEVEHCRTAVALQFDHGLVRVRGMVVSFVSMRIVVVACAVPMVVWKSHDPTPNILAGVRAWRGRAPLDARLGGSAHPGVGGAAVGVQGSEVLITEY